MALTIVNVGGVVAFGHDVSTGERGFLARVTNRTGHTSVKGELVTTSTTADNEIVLQTNEYDTFGVIAEAGIAQGQPVWMWNIGSICLVLYKDGVAATRGNLLIAADTDGRAIDIANPGTGLPAAEIHFKECGHVMQSVNAGTNVLVLAMLHFN